MKQSNLQDELKNLNILSAERFTILYLRLSRDDDKEGESNSISNQRILLTNYAKKNKFRNIKVIIDDGVSGVTFNRAGFKELLHLIDSDMVSTLIVKDMSRLGRNHLEVGNLIEMILPMHDVRLISVNENIDSDKGEDDFTPFRNIMNEWYAKDISRKLRSSYRIKSKQGYAIGVPPFGYTYGKDDSKKWVIEPESAKTVRYIYSLRLKGESVNKIAEKLRREKIQTPSFCMAKTGNTRAFAKTSLGEYSWSCEKVRRILTNQSYVGDVINFKTYSKSFKLKRRLKNAKENWEIYKDVHEPIIEREIWESIQKTFGTTKSRTPKYIEKNMFSGFLKCSDCGANLNYKFTHDNPDNHYFSCKNKRANNGLCKTTHHIRVDSLTRIVKNNIAEIVKFANNFEDEFVKLVVDENYKLTCERQKHNNETLKKLLSRYKELDILIGSLFEEKVLGNLTEERFKKLTYQYEDEQSELTQKIKNIQKIVSEDKKHELNVDGFLEIVKRYSEIGELSSLILNEFIDKIIIYHREVIDNMTSQKVEIYYKMIGNIQIPNLSRKEENRLIKYFGRFKNEKIALTEGNRRRCVNE